MRNKPDIERLHYYASLFSRSFMQRSLKNKDFSLIAHLVQKYDSNWASANSTYWDYLNHIYRVLEKEYRNEYVYKNTFISEWLIKKYSLKDTKTFSEFRIGSSIADLVLFNGSSKAFEIKTELDSNKRLISQLDEYSKLVEECYIVVPEELINEYLSGISPAVGVLAVKKGIRSLKIEAHRNAQKNEHVDINVLMASVHCTEYKWMTEQAYGNLPDVSTFEMFDACKERLSKLPSGILHKLFLAVVKKRKNITYFLNKIPKPARQCCLASDMNEKLFSRLNELYSQPIAV